MKGLMKHLLTQPPCARIYKEFIKDLEMATHVNIFVQDTDDNRCVYVHFIYELKNLIMLVYLKKCTMLLQKVIL